MRWMEEKLVTHMIQALPVNAPRDLVSLGESHPIVKCRLYQTRENISPLQHGVAA